MKISIQCIYNARGFSKHTCSHSPKFLLTEACLLLAESRECGRLLDGQLSTTRVLSGHMLESPGGVFQKYSFQSPIPKWVSMSGQGVLTLIFWKKTYIYIYPHVNLTCNHGWDSLFQTILRGVSTRLVWNMILCGVWISKFLQNISFPSLSTFWAPLTRACFHLFPGGNTDHDLELREGGGLLSSALKDPSAESSLVGTVPGHSVSMSEPVNSNDEAEKKDMASACGRAELL